MENNKIKAVKLLFVFVCVAVMLSGCWDRREIEAQATVVALALDQDEEGVRATIQVPIPTKIVGGGGSEGDGGGGQEVVQLFAANGQDLTDALTNIQKQLNHDLNLGHMRLVVLSETIARSGLEDVIDAVMRMPEVRRRLWPVVVEGKAADALKANPKLEQIPAVYMIEMIENEVRRERQFDMTLGRFVSKLKDEAEQPLLNMYKVTDKSMSWTGAALFQRDRMVGKLNAEESTALMQLRKGTKHGYRVTAPCPGRKGKKVTFEPKGIKRKVTLSEKPLSFHIRIDVEGRIIEKTCQIDLSKDDHVQHIARQLKQEYEREARQVVQKMQRERIEAAQLGTEVRAYHPRIWRNINWKDQFPAIDIDIAYDVSITGIGTRHR